jgi:hypothetical protein
VVGRVLQVECVFVGGGGRVLQVLHGIPVRESHRASVSSLTEQAAGDFPIRLAKTQHLDKQRDSEKKKNAIRKSSARNDQIRGLFGSPP